MGKQIIITGGAGFIGSHYAKYVAENHPDYDISIVDKFTYAGSVSNIQELISKNIQDLLSKKQAYLYVRDIADPKVFDGIDHIDYIVNFAAETFVDTSITGDHDVFVRSNILGPVNMMNYVKNNKHVRYLQISTDEVYGDLPIDSTEKFDTKSQIRPSNPYAASKAAADHFVQSFVRTYGIDAVITRCTNNYGPNQHSEKLIPQVIWRALQNEQVPVYGTGQNVRDWIYVSDHCQGIDMALHQGLTGRVYNFGGNAEKSNIIVVHKILDILCKPYSLVEYVSDRLGHDMRYAIDTRESESYLNWAPTCDFDKHLEYTVQWYKEHYMKLL